MKFDRDPQAAQIRGDIQQGLTGDKRPGIDLAAAPMETDGEASGVPLSAEQVRISRTTQSAGKPQDVSSEYGTAMRPQPGHPRKSYNSRAAFAVIAACVIILVLLVGAALSLQALQG